MANPIRRVTPYDDLPAEPSFSAISAPSVRKPRWTTTPPAYAGWWAVRLIRDRSKPEIIYFDGARERGTALEFSDRAYQFPGEANEFEVDGPAEWPTYSRHSPYVSIIPDDDDEEYSSHTPTWWTTLGIMIGVLIGIVLMFGMEWLSIHHGG